MPANIQGWGIPKKNPRLGDTNTCTAVGYKHTYPRLGGTKTYPRLGGYKHMYPRLWDTNIYIQELVDRNT